MTTKPSPKELIADYCQRARADAAEAETATDRSAFPGLLADPTGMIFTARDTLMFQPTGAPARPLTEDILNVQMVAIDSSTVISDKGTMSRLKAFAAAGTGSDAHDLRRRIDVLGSFTESVKAPVLTGALSSRYWLPEDMDEDSLGDWADALDVKGPTQATTLRSLMTLARDGITPLGMNFDKEVKKLESRERDMLDSAVYSDVGSDCVLLERLEGHDAIATGLRVLDPALLDFHMLDGQVSRVQPLGVTHKTFSAKVSSPFKLKEGGVRLTDGKAVRASNLSHLSYGEGVLHAVFDIPNSKMTNNVREMVENAYNGYGALYATEKLFVGATSKLQNRRWLGGDVEPVKGRKVPLSVILAGAPVDMAA